MEQGTKRSVVPGVDDRPAAPPSCEPLGVLSSLPEGLLGRVCSFLPGGDLACLGGCCSALHDSPNAVWPRLKLGLRGGLSAADEADEEARQRRVKAVSMLASRAAGVVKELRLEEARAVVPFCSAMREGGWPLRLLTSLHLFPHDETKGHQSDGSAGGPEQLVAAMMNAGQLPELRELRLSREERVRLGPVRRALGEGACPRLERISLWKCRPGDLAGLAAALGARPESCADLRATCVDLSEARHFRKDEPSTSYSEAMAALLSRLTPGSLEELELTDLPPAPCFRESLLPLLTSGCAALKTLRLSLVPDGDFSSADGLLHALAGGAAPSLTHLSLEPGCRTCSDEAWLALGEAMGPAGTCLRRVKTLELSGNMWGSMRQLEIFSRAVGAGHGCPELESLTIGLFRNHEDGPGACGADLAHAFRPPNGLPRLKKLHLQDMYLRDLDQLFEALGHRPHAVEPIESIHLPRRHRGDANFDQAMAWGGLLAGLKELAIDKYGAESEGEWHLQLLEALAGEAGQRLEMLELDCCGRGWASERSLRATRRFLDALATQGACSKLQTLSMSRGEILGGVSAQHLDAWWLGEILAGRAACSATFKRMDLAYGFRLSSEGVRTLAACLRRPQAIELESLSFSVVGRDCAASVMELLDALQGRAGSRLRWSSIWLTEDDKREAERVVDHLVDVIMAGGLPAMSPSDDPADHDEASARDEGRRWQDDFMMTVSSGASWPSDIGADKVERAVASRAEARWLASW